MRWRFWIIVEWVSALVLFLATTLWWVAMLAFASSVGAEDLTGLPYLVTSLYLLGWPVALLLALLAFLVAIFAWRKEHLRLTLLATAVPFVVWIITALPFQVWFFFFS